LAKITDESVDQYMAFSEYSYGFVAGEIMPENVFNRVKQDSLKKVANQVKVNYQFVTGTTKEQIKKVVIQYKEDYDKLVTELEKKFTEMSAKTHSRAKTIARTETQMLAGAGSNEGAKEAGATHKEWVWSGIERDTHAEMDGQTVKINEAFRSPLGNTLMFPGDPSAPPEEIINCGCEMIPIFEVE